MLTFAWGHPMTGGGREVRAAFRGWQITWHNATHATATDGECCGTTMRLGTSPVLVLGRPTRRCKRTIHSVPLDLARMAPRVATLHVTRVALAATVSSRGDPGECERMGKKRTVQEQKCKNNRAPFA